jgi:hypothetical protein
VNNVFEFYAVERSYQRITEDDLLSTLTGAEHELEMLPSNRGYKIYKVTFEEVES